MNSPKLKIINGHAYANSLDLAKQFNKQHKNVIRDIRDIIFESPNDFSGLNFEPVEYKDAKGEMRPMYQISRDGFSILAMGFTGREALLWKIEYLKAFNALERELSFAKKRIETLEQLEMFPEQLREKEFTIVEVQEKLASVGLFDVRTSASSLKRRIKSKEIIGRFCNRSKKFLVPESAVKTLIAA